MRIISRKRLRAFWASRKSDAALTERDLLAWHRLAKNAVWANFAAVRQTLGSTDQVDNCVVFDVGNNGFRLIARLNYTAGIVYMLQIMNHPEYDKQRWVNSCGCHRPAPKRKAIGRQSPRIPKKGRSNDRTNGRH